MKGDGLQGGEGGRSAGKGREEKRRVDGGIKGVARQGFRTHTLPRTLFPQGALDARTQRTHACQHSGTLCAFALCYI